MYTFRIEVYTNGLLISGSYDLPLYRRVSGALNSGIYRYITLYDATIAPLTHPQHIKRVSQLLVDWSSALLVAVLDEPPPPADFQTEEPARRDTQPMMFFTPAFALRADFYKRPDLSMGETLERMSEDFMSVTAVQIFPLNGGQPVAREFACLSRNHIQAMYTIGEATVPVFTPAAPAPAPTSPGPPAPGDVIAPGEPQPPEDAAAADESPVDEQQ